MPSTEVQRTLVKSPPELWAELSDPASLTRHLGELGEIQLTRVEPESAVEWEAENVKGSVQLKASGWGTKVTFSLTRELPEQAVAEPEPTAIEPDPATADPEPELTEPEPPIAEPELTEPEPPIAEPALVEPETAPEPERASRRSFFARLFRRRRKETVASTLEPVADTSELEDTAELELADSVAEGAEVAEPVAEGAEVADPVAEGADPIVETPEENLPSASVAAVETIENAPDLAAELATMEQAMVEQDTALLTAVLDRLGAAHHRPFSRG
jgi:hypothetical protein